MNDCPSCHKRLESDTLEECPYCLIIFKKYNDRRGRIVDPISAAMLAKFRRRKVLMFAFLIIPTLLLLGDRVLNWFLMIKTWPTMWTSTWLFLPQLCVALLASITFYPIFWIYLLIPAHMFPEFFNYAYSQPLHEPIGLAGDLVFIGFYAILYLAVIWSVNLSNGKGSG